MDHELLATLEHQDHGLQQPRMGVEPEPQLAERRAVVQGLNPQRPLSGLLGILSGNPVLEGGVCCTIR